MSRADRLFQITQILSDGSLHRAEDIAAQVAVSPRTIYRDMDMLVASGFPLQGTRGEGYRAEEVTTLPPLTLTPQEIEALSLSIAIAAELNDPDLSAAARSLTAKIDAALPQKAAAWHFADTPFANSARGIRHMPLLRAAIKSRQKLRLTYMGHDGAFTSRTVRPLQMEYFGRIWTLTAWCELRGAHRVFRVDLVDTAEALPELFTDEPGKTLDDFKPRSSS